MNFIPKMSEIHENYAKKKTLSQLRLMSDRQLIDCGYSPEFLNEGVKAWPWRELPENIPPLRFDQTLSLSTVSTKIERGDTSPEKSILAQKCAA